MSLLSNQTYYNCCTDCKEPDWSRFTGLELGGCKDHGGTTEGGVAWNEAEFFTVYGRDHDGMAEAITDIPAHRIMVGYHGLGHATAIAAVLGLRSRLPVTLYMLVQ